MLDNEGDQLLVLTNYMAPNYKVVKSRSEKSCTGKLDRSDTRKEDLLEWVNASAGKLLPDT